MNVEIVACIGAGLIGQGWATVFSAKGYSVVLQDIRKGILDNALQRISSNLEFLSKHNLLIDTDVASAIKRIETTTSVAAASQHADYVQESVLEDYPLKKEVFNKIDASAPEHAILASSTSGLLMTEIQKATNRPDRCVLVHPVLPVHLIPVVEIAGGAKTSLETIEIAGQLMKELGKTTVMLKREVPGYIVNRLQAALLREAIDLVDKGVATAEDVDRAFCMGTGLRDPIVGPLLRVHLAGDGIENFLSNYAQSYRYRWEDMGAWTTIPKSAAKSVVKGIYDMEIVRSKTLNEIKAWRDEELVKLMKVLHP